MVDGYAIGLDTTTKLFIDPTDDKASLIDLALVKVIFDNFVEYFNEQEFLDEVRASELPWVVVFDFEDNALLVDLYAGEDNYHRYKKNFDRQTLKLFWEAYSHFGVLLVSLNYMDEKDEIVGICGTRIIPDFIYAKNDGKIQGELEAFFERN